MITVLTWIGNEAMVNDLLAYKIKQDSDTGWWYAYRGYVRLTVPPHYLGTEFDARNVAQTDAERQEQANSDPRNPVVRG
jgi:hypothetical protein